MGHFSVTAYQEGKERQRDTDNKRVAVSGKGLLYKNGEISPFPAVPVVGTTYCSQQGVLETSDQGKHGLGAGSGCVQCTVITVVSRCLSILWRWDNGWICCSCGDGGDVLDKEWLLSSCRRASKLSLKMEPATVSHR